MHKFILHLILIIAYFVIGAYATSDVSRLLKGATISVTNPSCYCPFCNAHIPLRFQIPVLSYLLGKGKCRSCGHGISLLDILPEILLPSGFIILSYSLHFSILGYLCCILLFESYKCVSIIHYQPRESQFLKNLLISILYNFIIFLFLGFLFFLINLV